MTKQKSNSKSKSKSKDKKSEGGLPKKVAGMKLPKAVKDSGALSTLFNSNLGREILADALIAAAGAAAAALTRTRAAKNAGHAVADAGSEAASMTSELMQTAAGAVAGVVTDAAKNFLPPSLLGEEKSGGRGKARGETTDDGDQARPQIAGLVTDSGARKATKGASKAERPAKR